ncbi:hypothetical protein CEXT_119331 [Caerostris extrusa]|uniref:Uncharacterized protein n=1 Tax=Caerostris extrusa TaxID=172846 RepID=A0AAV4MQZ7_CAEEX|nr:hypothetical protein CEXT_119331 [Caerostris extrusa]
MVYGKIAFQLEAYLGFSAYTLILLIHLIKSGSFGRKNPFGGQLVNLWYFYNLKLPDLHLAGALTFRTTGYK